MDFDRRLFDAISWNASGSDIERESMRRIESEVPFESRPATPYWIVARRLLHASADIALLNSIVFSGSPVAAILEALSSGAPIYCDSNMIKAGISAERLRQMHPGYTKDAIVCPIADSDVVVAAKASAISRAIASVQLRRQFIHGAVVLVGNAPLALAEIIRIHVEEGITPAAIIGMPVGFVNVIEAKQLLFASSIPFISIEGRRGGSPLAVATLHGAIESAFFEED